VKKKGWRAAHLRFERARLPMVLAQPNGQAGAAAPELPINKSTHAGGQTGADWLYLIG